MAVPAQTLLHHPAAAHCGFHHGPANDCPDLGEELGDLIPELTARGVRIQLIPAGLFPERCEDCIAAGDPVLDAVAVVCHMAPSEALPEGYTCRAHVCGVHLRSNVTWEIRRGCVAWIEIPVDFGPAAA